MKKVILCTVVSLFIFSGFVAGPWGADLAEAQIVDLPALQAAAPGVEAFVLIYKGHKIKLLPGAGIVFGKPRPGTGQPRVPQTDKPGPPVNTRHGELPIDLQYEEPLSAKLSTIKVYGDKTCMVFNGTLYCW